MHAFIICRATTGATRRLEARGRERRAGVLVEADLPSSIIFVGPSRDFSNASAHRHRAAMQEIARAGPLPSQRRNISTAGRRGRASMACAACTGDAAPTDEAGVLMGLNAEAATPQPRFRRVGRRRG